MDLLEQLLEWKPVARPFVGESLEDIAPHTDGDSVPAFLLRDESVDADFGAFSLWLATVSPGAGESRLRLLNAVVEPEGDTFAGLGATRVSVNPVVGSDRPQHLLSR